MKKNTYLITMNYTYDTHHSGAHYQIGGRYVNNGEFAEIITKSVLGFTATKDANTTYDKGSDIEELNASVKSSRFTLTTVKLGDSFEESVNRYFETVHSTCWIYTVVMEKEVTLYTMNANEFKSFLYSFCSLNERGLVRGRATSTKMVAWLENRVD